MPRQRLARDPLPTAPRRNRRLRVGVDVGGTFTDFALFDEVSGDFQVHKVPTTAPDESRGFLSGLLALLRTTQATPGAVAYLAHGTTVATNAMLQGRLANVGLITTQGFRDLLEIRRQKRPDLYDLFYIPPAPPISRELRVEVPERIAASGDVLLPLDESAVATAAIELKEQGVRAICVCFVNSYAFQDHEVRAAAIAREASGLPVWASSEVLAEFREFERLSTTVIHAGLGPVIDGYLRRLVERLERRKFQAPVHVMQSNGGVMSIAAALERPANTLLSGPSAGVVGALHVARMSGEQDLITFDMGGTSTDVCLVRAGAPEVSMERDLNGYPLRAPMIDVHTVGAGGGSVAWIDAGGRLKVGPTSVGARPGPAAYGLGGTEATVTDANIVLGRLSPAGLLGGAVPLDAVKAREAVKSRVADPLGMEVVPAAAAIIAIANSNMVLAARSVSIRKGIDPREFVLVAYGGAGPLHAGEVSAELGTNGVLIPESPGVVCALGLLTSDLQSHYVKTVMVPALAAVTQKITEEWDRLVDLATQWLETEAVDPTDRLLERSVDMRYKGQNHELRVAVPADRWDTGIAQTVETAFHRRHSETFGYASPEESIEIVSLRVSATGRTPRVRGTLLSRESRVTEATGERDVWWDSQGGFMPTPVFQRELVESGFEIVGPAIIEQMDSTTLVLPGLRARIDDNRTLRLDVPPSRRPKERVISP